MKSLLRFIALPLLCITGQAAQAQNAADAYYDPADMARARAMFSEMGGSTNYLVIGERLENQVHEGDSSLVWEAQGWIGKDLDKLWVKTEGHYNAEENDTEEFELQALWSHALHPFWDLQLGLRHDFETVSRDYAVIGLMGLAPYWFEIDAAAFVSDEGNVSTRLEAEYEMRFTQRLILQPRVEFNYAFDDDLEIGVGQGLNKVHAGLRLRYEFKREIAPYIGVAWEKSFGSTANLLEAAGQDTGEASFVAGVRVWY